MATHTRHRTAKGHPKRAPRALLQAEEAGLEQIHAIERQEILRRYARLLSSGYVTLCSAPRAGPDPDPGSDMKVIFPTVEAALDCARALQILQGGRRQRAYPCERSRRRHPDGGGHYHLTSSWRGL